MKSFARLRGFTLLELLLVVSILAATSSIGISLYYNSDGDDVDTRARVHLAQAEMLNIAKAVRQFKQDTGYYPGQGPFAYLDYSQCGSSCNCADDAGNVDSIGGLDPVALVAVAGGTPREWGDTPANMLQLLQRPVICSNHALVHLASWDEVNQQGWRGPYLTNEGFTDISGDLSASGDGDPLATWVLALRNIPAIADPFSHNEPEVVPTANVDFDGYLLDWRTFSAGTDVYSSGLSKPARIGSAYYLLGRDGCSPLRIVSTGYNGVYESAHSSNLSNIGGCVLDATQRATNEQLKASLCASVPPSDDVVMCL